MNCRLIDFENLSDFLPMFVSILNGGIANFCQDDSVWISSYDYCSLIFNSCNRQKFRRCHLLSKLFQIDGHVNIYEFFKIIKNIPKIQNLRKLSLSVRPKIPKHFRFSHILKTGWGCLNSWMVDILKQIQVCHALIPVSLTYLVLPNTIDDIQNSLLSCLSSFLRHFASN